MHKLVRQVRFSLNPFIEKEEQGFNSYASKPTGQGLSLFFEIGVELSGNIEPSTGFLVNVVDIDKKVRDLIVPVFSKYIRKSYKAGKEIELSDITKLLGLSWRNLTGVFPHLILSKLNLKLNPFRQISIDSEAGKMIYFSEKFEFAATHKLWNEDFTEQRNLEVFGKCANPSGHGHNYIVEITVKTRTSGGFNIAEFERIVDKELIQLFDHKNLNENVEFFNTTNPTMENIAVFAWEKLAGNLNQQKLHCVTIWESERTCCSYYGSQKNQ
ncbi:MAG: 6-pyruvoyl trahydropterin synthase family protein [Planctomycetota bacterium]|jgi:6-pyruvoyltetrahydropterin/6-carboxytetrahydropterin synthase